MDTATHVIIFLSATALTLAVMIMVYAVKVLEQCRSYLYFVWDLVHNAGDFKNAFADLIAEKLQKRKEQETEQYKREGTD